MEDPIIHLPLTEHPNCVTTKLDVVNHGVEFGAPGPGGQFGTAAQFRGKRNFLEVADCELLKLGKGDFSVAVWVHTDRTCDVVGDLVSKFDDKERRGFSLGVVSHAGVIGAQSNYRDLHFGIDNAKAESEWTDCGRPGEAAKIFALTVFRGDLYAGTFEWDGVGHVYRYAGEGRWLDCGSPDPCNSVASLAVHDGELYCGVGGYLSEGSMLPHSPNEALGGKVYRYAGGTEWIDCGLPKEGARMAAALVTYRGKLYVSFLYEDEVYVYEGGKEWAPVGLQGVKLLAKTVYRGSLYGVEQGMQGEGHSSGVYRYEGGSEWNLVAELPGARQAYSTATYRGDLYVGSWPQASIYRGDPDGHWEMVTSRVGYECEVMGMNVYNGKLYCGALPSASVNRYEGNGRWTFMGILDTSNAILRRAWSMCVHDGRLHAGTLPSGHVRSFQAGVMATHDEVLPDGWHHVAAVRAGPRLRLFLDGREVARPAPFNPEVFDLTNHAPLMIGFGAQDYFEGAMCDFRLYDRALEDSEVARLASPAGH